MKYFRVTNVNGPDGRSYIHTVGMAETYEKFMEEHEMIKECGDSYNIEETTVDEYFDFQKHMHLAFEIDSPYLEFVISYEDRQNIRNNNLVSYLTEYLPKHEGWGSKGDITFKIDESLASEFDYFRGHDMNPELMEGLPNKLKVRLVNECRKFMNNMLTEEYKVPESELMLLDEE